MCILITFTILTVMFILFRIAFIYYLVRTWNEDYDKYLTAHHMFGYDLDVRFSYYHIYPKTIYFKLNKWTIRSILEEDDLVKDVNNFIFKLKGRKVEDLNDLL